jgi:hypothetical protein
MLANFSRVNTATDFEELVLFTGQVNEAIRTFVDLGDRFRKATSRNLTPCVLKHDVNTVFAVQAGDLLCQCWRRGMLSVYRPQFYLPEEDEPRNRYAFSWFTFIRWHVAPIFKSRFRDDWKAEFAPEMDQLKGLDYHPQKAYQSAASEDANDLVVWRLNLYADVQAAACDILVEELGQLAGAAEQCLGLPPGGTRAKPKGRSGKSKDKPSIEELYYSLPEDQQDELWIFVDFKKFKCKIKNKTKAFLQSRKDLSKYNEESLKELVDRIRKLEFVKGDKDLRNLSAFRSKILKKSIADE